MLLELFSKNVFIRKNVEQSQKGKTSVKNVIINHISSEHLRNIYYATVFLKL